MNNPVPIKSRFKQSNRLESSAYREGPDVLQRRVGLIPKHRLTTRNRKWSSHTEYRLKARAQKILTKFENPCPLMRVWKPRTDGERNPQLVCPHGQPLQDLKALCAPSDCSNQPFFKVYFVCSECFASIVYGKDRKKLAMLSEAQSRDVRIQKGSNARTGVAVSRQKKLALMVWAWVGRTLSKQAWGLKERKY